MPAYCYWRNVDGGEQNGSVYMSEETIALVISVAALMLTLAAGFGWMIRRMDVLRKDLSEEIKSVRQDLGDRITGVERELVEVKIAVARIEGPGRHLVTAR